MRSKWKGSKQLRHLLVRESGRCHYCGLGVEILDDTPNHPRNATIDHKHPISRGGANDRANLVLACALCNHRKADMTAEEFLVYRRFIMLGKTKAEARLLLLERLAQLTDDPSEGIDAP